MAVFDPPARGGPGHPVRRRRPAESSRLLATTSAGRIVTRETERPGTMTYAQAVAYVDSFTNYERVHQPDAMRGMKLERLARMEFLRQ